MRPLAEESTSGNPRSTTADRVLGERPPARALATTTVGEPASSSRPRLAASAPWWGNIRRSQVSGSGREQPGDALFLEVAGEDRAA